MSYPEANEPQPQKKSDKSLLGKVVTELGGVVFAVEAIDKTLSFTGRFFRDNKYYQNTIKMVRGVTPVIITGHKVYNAYKEYNDEKKHQYARQKKASRILTVMGQEVHEEWELDQYPFEVGKEIINWFATSPKTEDFKIVEFYNSDFEKISLKNFEKGETYTYVEYKGLKFMIEAELSTFNSRIIVQESSIHTISNWNKVNELKGIIFSEFIKHFDVVNNVIEMVGGGITTRPRMSFDYPICQIDIEGLKSEIKKSVEKNKKRGYVMVGPPGVGKSTAIVKLEKELPEIPIVYVNSSSSGYRDDVAALFKFFRSISPCIVIFEDLDSYELSNKYDRLFGEFLEQMDSLKHEESIIVIATLNEPENVHNSLINRRGRFDKVFFINYPKTEEEIMNVIKNKYKKETNKEFPLKDIGERLISIMIDCKFSHADICEVIDSMIINDMDITKENIAKSIDGVVQTMKAILMCENEEDEE